MTRMDGRASGRGIVNVLRKVANYRFARLAERIDSI